jgi:hypothetical protein
LIDDFLKDHTVGLEDYLGFLRKARWDDIVEATGLTLEQIHSTGERLLASHATIVCWAMGLNQHKHSLPTLRDVVNVLLLQGNIGKPGAGVCPVRGRSNVQGDRTMGIFEKMPAEFHDMLDQQFGFLSPRKHGYDTVAAIRAMRDGKVRVFIGMGGTFVVPHPPRDARRFETPSGKAHFTGNELEFIKVPPGGWSCRRCAHTTSTTPPSTARTTDTAASTVAAGWSWSTGRTSPSSDSATATWFTWYPSSSGLGRPSANICLRSEGTRTGQGSWIRPRG